MVDLNRIPASAVVKRHLQRAAARQALLAGGDDYELVFTAGRARRAAIRRLSRRLRLKLTLIGSITRRRGSGTPVTVLDPAGRPIVTGRKGYEHF